MIAAWRVRITFVVATAPLLAAADGPLVVEPVRPARVEQVPMRAGHPAPRVDLDPAVLGPAPGQAAPPLRREGEFIVQRLGRVVRLEAHGGRWVFQPAAAGEDEAAALPAMVIQPSTRLQTIVSYIRQARGEQEAEAVEEGWFVLSGRVHTYRGVNHLLVTAMRPYVEREPEADAPEAEQAAADEPAEQEAAPADELEQLMQRLLERRAAPPVPTAPRPATGVEAAELRDEGELVIQRRGRLARTADGAEAMFVFDADAPGAEEPPMRLMPCQLLASMENTAARRGGSTVFVVSGMVYTYRGQNYLLPTNMRLARPHANLQ